MKSDDRKPKTMVDSKAGVAVLGAEPGLNNRMLALEAPNLLLARQV